jgi:hypothetical protein
MKSEEYKDQGLRQALQRRNENTERMTLPEDFTDRLMQRIEQKEEKPKHRRTWLYTTIGAVAASILLLLTFHYAQNAPKTEKGMVMAERTEQQKQPSKPEAPRPDGQNQSQQTEKQNNPASTYEGTQMPMIAQEKAGVVKPTAVSQRPRAASVIQKTSTNISTTDSLDYYIDKIERELAQVDESLYIEKMNKVIRADERLQRMVSSYILHNLDKEGRPQTAENIYNEKTEQDEE